MKQNEIIEMAREAGFFIIANSPDLFSKLVAFANLVAAKEREALAQTQEPVAWTLADKVRQDLDRQSCPDAFMRIAVESIVKHHPPQRTWVGLTNEERIEIDHLALSRVQAAQMTEAKLKEKNSA
jgi:hypothetical protein